MYRVFVLPKPVLAVVAGLLALLAVVMVIHLTRDNTPTWVQVTDQAAWPARDSQGELVYDDKLWIFGGWRSSSEAPPRDVWNSGDGKKWWLINKSAPWIHSDLPMALTFKNKMWLMGGWYNGRLPGRSASNLVWSSTDGANWTRTKAAWSPRLAAGLVEFKGKMWLLGGSEDYFIRGEQTLKNDVWSSADGEHWQLVTDNARWRPRAFHAALAFDNKLWIFGGGDYEQYEAYNDVWSSPDGVNWTEVTASAPWIPRLWFSAAVYRGRMWILGGWHNNPSTNLNDIWTSTDGKEWVRFQPGVTWKARHEHATFVFQDKLWVAGGSANPLNSEVWSLFVPPDWFDRKNRQ